jgi:hypothetical protein
MFNDFKDYKGNSILKNSSSRKENKKLTIDGGYSDLLFPMKFATIQKNKPSTGKVFKSNKELKFEITDNTMLLKDKIETKKGGITYRNQKENSLKSSLNFNSSVSNNNFRERSFNTQTTDDKTSKDAKFLKNFSLNAGSTFLNSSTIIGTNPYIHNKEKSIVNKNYVCSDSKKLKEELNAFRKDIEFDIMVNKRNVNAKNLSNDFHFNDEVLKHNDINNKISLDFSNNNEFFKSNIEQPHTNELKKQKRQKNIKDIIKSQKSQRVKALLITFNSQ